MIEERRRILLLYLSHLIIPVKELFKQCKTNTRRFHQLFPFHRRFTELTIRTCHMINLKNISDVFSTCMIQHNRKNYKTGTKNVFFFVTILNKILVLSQFGSSCGLIVLAWSFLNIPFTAIA